MSSKPDSKPDSNPGSSFFVFHFLIKVNHQYWYYIYQIDPWPLVSLKMRGLEERTSKISRFGGEAKSHIYRAWDGFIDFAARDNVLEVALGLM